MIHMRPTAIGLNDIKKHTEQHMGVRQICVYIYVQEIEMQKDVGMRCKVWMELFLVALLEAVVVVKNLHRYDGIRYVPGGVQDGPGVINEDLADDRNMKGQLQFEIAKLVSQDVCSICDYLNHWWTGVQFQVSMVYYIVVHQNYQSRE